MHLKELIYSNINYNKSPNAEADAMIAEDCNCCLRALENAANQANNNIFDGVSKQELQYFLDNDILSVVDAFRQTFGNDINNNLMDTYGNISNFTMRNEVVRLNANAKMDSTSTNTLSYLYQQ